MLILTYAEEIEEYKIDFQQISSHIVQLKGNFPIKNTGFILSRPENNDNWDYKEYTTIYREIDGGVQLSDDGSVYESVSVSEPELTQEELAEQERQQAVMELMTEIANLKTELAATDYQIIKCSECSLAGEEMPYDIWALHTERQLIRDEINQKENELKEVLES
ncbi:MAG: hypothetical protein IJ711_00810 [Lachnospiraceae bacterium]|nr:hypothetical protein [Lachnospiraceae bacterium]